MPNPAQALLFRRAVASDIISQARRRCIDLRLLGVGMVFISHHLDEIFTICDRITVLRDGAYIETLATGAAWPITTD